MDGIFEIFEYSKFQDVNETIVAACLSIFIARTHMKKQHTAELGYFFLPERCCHIRGAGRIFAGSECCGAGGKAMVEALFFCTNTQNDRRERHHGAILGLCIKSVQARIILVLNRRVLKNFIYLNI
ncbi:hypothetical protein [Janthinobacterium sp. SUN137]|uniref:hypothetical protein n=1 Tax=Janthinobacterium sp. SUN137 TaxID=3014789 RepID=UPI002712692E|nr:hypothetical protein [Janthinobacterium sp. SUN137]MDO8042518.1 hypothetical protein [Janthinobacterium sp. SUN137]